MGAATVPAGPVTSLKNQDAQKSQDVEVAEVGRLHFEPKKAVLPFEATLGKRGAKVKKLQRELRKTEQEQDRLRRAEAEGHGEEVRRDLAMQKALKRARGEKVHDDTTKLRKAQKTLELKRKRGKDKWDERKEEAKQQQDKHQQERKENLQKRPTKKKNKAKIRMGFEGKSGFLNSNE